MKTVALIVSRWRWEDKHCQNYTKVCFVKDKIHYLFLNEENNAWAAAMITGTHTVDAPPSEVQGSVMSPRVGRLKASTMLTTIPALAPTNVNNYNFYGESTMPPGFHFPSPHHSALARGFHVQPQVQPQGRQESSPVGSDSDPGERVDSYLTWLSQGKLLAPDLAHVDGIEGEISSGEFGSRRNSKDVCCTVSFYYRGSIWYGVAYWTVYKAIR